MDLGAIILDPFDLRHLAALYEAIAETCGEYGIEPSKVRVAFSAHRELGRRLVVHIDPRGDEDAYDPFLFLTDHEGFGASLSGFFGDRLGEDQPTSRAWSVSRERRTGYCVVDNGIYYTAGDADGAEDDGPLRRLAKKLGVDRDLLEGLIETPSTAWSAATTAPTSGVIAELTARVSGAVAQTPSRR